MAQICSEICLREVTVAIYYFLGKEKKNLSLGIKALPTLCQAAELTVLKNALVTILISGCAAVQITPCLFPSFLTHRADLCPWQAVPQAGVGDVLAAGAGCALSRQQLPRGRSSSALLLQ